VTERDCQGRHPISPTAPVRPPGAGTSDFEREYYSFFDVRPSRLFKFLLRELNAPDIINLVVQHDHYKIFPEFRQDLGVHDTETWSDSSDSDRVTDTAMQDNYHFLTAADLNNYRRGVWSDMDQPDKRFY